jgi:hypothetical protein
MLWQLPGTLSPPPSQSWPEANESTAHPCRSLPHRRDNSPAANKLLLGAKKISVSTLNDFFIPLWGRLYGLQELSRAETDPFTALPRATGTPPVPL